MQLRRRIIIGQPQGITLKSYISGDGTAWINTDYMLPENAVIYVSTMWGGYGSNKAIVGTDATWIRQISSAGSERFGWKYNGGSEVQKNAGNFYNPSAELGLYITPSRGGGRSSSLVSITKGSSSSTTPLCIMESYPGSGMKHWNFPIGTVYVYDSSAAGVTTGNQLAQYTPIASFIPCTYGFKAGMYYVEEDRFCGNSNTSGVIRAYDTWPV